VKPVPHPHPLPYPLPPPPALPLYSHGLTSVSAKRRLEAFGPNALPEKKRNKLLMFLSYMNK
jgi:hypothetical protein